MPRAAARPAGHGVGRGDVRIGAVIDVEHGALRPFEEDTFRLRQGLVQVDAGIGNVARQAVAKGGILGMDGSEIERLLLEHGAQVRVLLFDGALQDICEHRFVTEIGEANADARHLVFVGRADAAAGGADAALAAQAFARQVDGAVVGHDQVRAVADLQQLVLREEAALPQLIDLGEEHGRIDDHAVADHAHFPGVQDAGRNQVQDRLVAIDDHGVAGIVAALVASDDVGVLGQKVDDLPLALIAPLRSDDDYCGHDGSLSSERRRGPSSQPSPMGRGSGILVIQSLTSCAETMSGNFRSCSSTGSGMLVVDVNERDRHAADLLPPELQPGDVDLGFAEQRANRCRPRRGRRGCAA